MRLISLAAYPAALFLPSRSTHVTAGKLALINMLFTIFFLFTAAYQFPGGSNHFPGWAIAIVQGTTLSPDFAQAEVGFPLLYLLSGFPFSHSFIGITLILAAFAVLMPILVYYSIEKASHMVAFLMGLVCILSLTSVTYIKFLYHDQAYMFFNLLAITLLIQFLCSGRFRLLYFWTFAALAASFTRTAGNLMYPVLLTIAFITVRGRFRHYLASVVIFALGVGLYQWHRYEIFDVAHHESTPSGKGMQIFYSMYLYTGDFGVEFSPDFGPYSKELFTRLRQDLQPSVRDSELIKRALPDDPADFMERHVYAYTPEELIERIQKEPNEEYWTILMGVVPGDDEFYLHVAGEIARTHPWYVVEYSMRNMWHAVFDPGWATTRYNTRGYLKTGNDFPPATMGMGIRSQDPVSQYGPRAVREMAYFPLKDRSRAIQQIFYTAQRLWTENYDRYVLVTSVLLVAAWIGAVIGALCWAFPHTRFSRSLAGARLGELMPPIVATSALLLYEDLATSMFSQPVYRYFHITEPERLIIGGYAIVFGMRVLCALRSAGTAATVMGASLVRREGTAYGVRRYDFLDACFGPRRTLWIWSLVAINAGLFAWWTSSMIAHTWGAPPDIMSATYGESCARFTPKPPAENSVRKDNATGYVRDACPGSKPETNTCSFVVNGERLGDPAPGCDKDFSVTYRCEPSGEPRTASIFAPAAGARVDLDCNAPPPKAPAGLVIRSATSGGNCGAADGNATRELAAKCNGQAECAYPVDQPPADASPPQCRKDLMVSYSCVPNTTILTSELRAGSGSDNVLKLSCLQQPGYDVAALPSIGAGQALDFLNGQNRGAFVSGWSPPEADGVWTMTNAAYFGFAVKGAPLPKELILHAGVWLIPGIFDKQQLQVWSAGKKLAEFEMTDRGPIDFRIPLGDIAVSDGAPVVLGLYLPNARPANQVVATSDTRALGLRVMSLRLVP